MRALDVASDTKGRAHEISALGFKAVGVYLRKDRCSLSMIEDLHRARLKVFSVWEKGHPTTVRYFTAEQGGSDAAAAVSFAKSIGQPSGSQIFAAVDYDVSWTTDAPEIIAYFKAFHEYVRTHDYLASVYGSGLVCAKLVELGYAHTGWLSESSAWAGFHDFMPKASIVQTKTETVLGFDVDLDIVQDPSVCW